MQFQSLSRTKLHSSAFLPSTIPKNLPFLLCYYSQGTLGNTNSKKVWIILQYGFQDCCWDFQLRCNLLSVQITNKHNKGTEGTPWNSYQTTRNNHQALPSDALPIPAHFPN